mgnify:CR=1 FL=1
MDETTIVLPSARAIRHEQLQIRTSSLFLPNFITMNEFISKLCIVDGFKTIDDDSRTILLLEASDFKGFSSLQIERNFFTFTKNSSYIFKFFEELSAELYNIKQLESSDIYAEYEEHITILNELYVRYEKLCLEKKVLDKIFLPKLYTFNKEYALKHEKIKVYIDGYLTNFEFELLLSCSNYSEVSIVFTASAFNIKMQTKLSELGIELEQGYEYLISINSKTILQKNVISKNSNINTQSFSESLLQVAFVKKSIYDFIKKGYEAQNIAVILPDEKMAQMLRSFDEKSNLNFAMGTPFTTTKLYTQLNATIKLIEQKSQENFYRLERTGDKLYMIIQEHYYKKSDAIDFIALLESCREHFTIKQEVKIFDEESHKFKHILPFVKEMSVKSLFNIFLSRLASKSLDDVRGGKITVMGVLETRSVHFDGVVIVDFDDKNVPKRSDKDMFLNSKIREIANLPTMSDRENLQKHYYEMLINRSKEVAISYVNSSQSSESRFLKQLGIKADKQNNEFEYAHLLFEKGVHDNFEEKEIIQEYSFKDVKLSATRLKTFLTCKRKYYYNYIEHIKHHEVPKDMPKEYEIGNAVHGALRELYSKKSFYDDITQLKRDLHKELDAQKGESELDSYLIAMQKKRMDSFCENEIERFKQGWQVLHTEESLSIEFAGVTLVGQIDRIDKKDNNIEVLDYKTGSYTLYNKNNYLDATDFQLEFYYLLSCSLGSVSCAFYDLKETKIVPEAFLDEKLGILESNIKDLLNIEEVNFSKCEDTKPCQFCEYALMCGR